MRFHRGRIAIRSAGAESGMTAPAHLEDCMTIRLHRGDLPDPDKSKRQNRQDIPYMVVEPGLRTDQDEEDYLARFPEQEGLTEQELMPKRIEYEAAERKRMEEERAELVKAKEKLVAENTRRKEEMKKMDEKLEAWVDGLGKLDEDLKKDL